MPHTDNDLREQILDTAKSLFIQQGYHGLAMRQISEALGVSKAALYYHFEDKEELFLAIISNNLDEIESAIDSIQSQKISCGEKIVLFVEHVLKQPAEQRAMIRLASQEMSQLSATARKKFDKTYHDQFTGKLQTIFEAGVRNGEFRPIDPAIATWALLGIMYPYFYPAHTGAMPVRPEIIRQIISIYLNGVAQPG
jgi:TetR/AcrR family transcriptional regulator, mexJK operon transcriptional repressor